MSLLWILLVLLLVTRLCGEIAARFRLPVLVGELLAGVLLGLLVRQTGSSLLVLSDLTEDHVFRAITDLGIFFLMLLAGFEMRPADMSRASRKASVVAFGGMLLPMLLGIGLGYACLPWSEWKSSQMLYLGVALSVTAVPITIATLMELKRHRSELGAVIISAAVFDDIFSLFLLAALTSVLEVGGKLSISSLGTLAGEIVVFFAITMLAGKYLFPLTGRVTRHLKIKHIEFSTLILWALAFGVLAEALHMHFILGAYAAGLFFTRQTLDDSVYDDVANQLDGITLGFFAPIFFASIGLHMDPRAIFSVPVFLGLLIVAAFLGKFVGAGLAARYCGFPPRESVAVGVGMNARGAVELIIASIALESGLFLHPQPPPPVVSNLFSAVVVMAMCAALSTPVGLRFILKTAPAEGKE